MPEVEIVAVTVFYASWLTLFGYLNRMRAFFGLNPVLSTLGSPLVLRFCNSQGQLRRIGCLAAPLDDEVEAHIPAEMPI